MHLQLAAIARAGINVSYLERTVQAIRVFVVGQGSGSKILRHFARMNDGLEKKSKCHSWSNFLHWVTRMIDNCIGDVTHFLVNRAVGKTLCNSNVQPDSYCRRPPLSRAP